MKLLLHTCCAPCSVYCIEKLKEDNIDITSYWYNPNIHPFKEYEIRLKTLKKYNEDINVPLIVNDYYGLKKFCLNVVDKLDNRCGYCYYCRLENVAKYAKENGFDAFSTTLLISPYQNHELIKKTGEVIEKKYSVKFLYKDFRPGFKKGYDIARKKGLYLQKYCGCIFSEEERYLDKIIKSKEKMSFLKLIKPSTMFKNEIIKYKEKVKEENYSFYSNLLLDDIRDFDKWIDSILYKVYLIIRKEDNKLLGMVKFNMDGKDSFLVNVSFNMSINDKNYLNELLNLIFLKCKKNSIKKLLMDYDENNIILNELLSSYDIFIEDRKNVYINL